MTGFDLTPLDAAAILIVLAAVLGYLNARFLKLPQTVGLTLMGAVASLAVIAVDRSMPGGKFALLVAGFVDTVDFRAILMDGMLSFLLFAGALHVDWSQMKRNGWAILALSTAGVVLSTVLIGEGFYILSGWLGLNLPQIWCLVFGAVISPTDPVAIIGVFKSVRVSPALRATVAGESLFNDGVGVVIFTILLATAVRNQPFSLGDAIGLFAVKAGGGIVLGWIIGWIAVKAMHSIDEYNVEVLLTLAVVMGGYALARSLHVSGPVAVAVAGLLVGNQGVKTAMSETTKDYLLKFWSLIDDILNAVLFLLIGLVVVTVPYNIKMIVAGLAAIPVALAARAISVLFPLTILRPFTSLGRMAPVTLIWGGLRGGISVALALSLPHGSARAAALTATYIIVLFSVIVQGGTIERVLNRQARRLSP